MLSLLQGNIDGLIGTADDRRPAIESGEVVPILSITPARAATAPDAPAIGELDLRPEQRALLDALLTLNELGRPLVGPAGIESGTLECLRTALATVVQDPDVVATAAQQRRGLSYLSGPDLDAVVGRIEALPQEFVGILRAALRQG
jgi:tripartite-type tricarboxylate transporter receptor subunit TctC